MIDVTGLAAFLEREGLSRHARLVAVNGRIGAPGQTERDMNRMRSTGSANHGPWSLHSEALNYCMYWNDIPSPDGLSWDDVYDYLVFLEAGNLVTISLKRRIDTEIRLCATTDRLFYDIDDVYAWFEMLGEPATGNRLAVEHLIEKDLVPSKLRPGVSSCMTLGEAVRLMGAWMLLDIRKEYNKLGLVEIPWNELDEVFRQCDENGTPFRKSYDAGFIGDEP